MSMHVNPGLVRTLVPIVIGPVLTRLLPGVDPESETVLLATSAVISYLYYVLVRLLELKAPTLGYLLGVAKAPAYSDKPAPSPDAGEEVVAVVVPEETAGASADQTPVATDNRARPEDPPQDVDQSSTPYDQG